MAVYCQTVPFVPESRPTWKQSNCTSSPGLETFRWRSGWGSGRVGSGGRCVAGDEAEALAPGVEAVALEGARPCRRAAQQLPDGRPGDMEVPDDLRPKPAGPHFRHRPASLHL